MKKIFVCLLLIFILAGCYYKAPATLPKEQQNELKSFVEKYEMLMTYTIVPKEIVMLTYNKNKEMDEYNYFRKLPAELQLKYMELYWEMRSEVLKKEYEERVAIANKLFKQERTNDAYKTDRGWILVICGFPDYVDTYKTDSSGDTMFTFEDDLLWEDPTVSVFQIWKYWYSPTAFLNHLIVFRFDYNFAQKIWRINEQYLETEQIRFIYHQAEHFAPLEWDGWEQVLTKYKEGLDK